MTTTLNRRNGSAPHPADDYNDRIPPHNLDAEQSVLGAVLLSRKAWEQVCTVITPDDFYRPAHQHVYEAMALAHRENQTVDAVLVAEQLTRMGLLNEVGGGGFLLELQSATPSISNAEHYAKLVRSGAESRRFIRLMGEMAQRGYDITNDAGALYEDVLIDLQRRRDDYLSMTQEVSTPRLQDLTMRPWSKPDMVWPGVLGRGHRLMLAGGGGAGKSTFFRQGIVFSAAGLHPYMGEHNDLVALPGGRQVRSLVVDLENDEDAWVLETRGMMDFVRARTGVTDLPVYVHAVGGRNYDPVRNRAHRADLWARLRTVRPDVLYFGPIYKMDQRGGETSWHSMAGEIQHMLDEARDTFGCAVILEAHVGKGSKLDPRGAADWGYWPELGITLQGRTGDPGAFRLRHFRGRRFASLYNWFPTEAHKHVRGVMPFRCVWPADHVDHNGYAWDQPPAPMPDDPYATVAAAASHELEPF